MKIEELKSLNDRLTALLNDPHPGVFTWCEAIHNVMNELINKWMIEE